MCLIRGIMERPPGWGRGTERPARYGDRWALYNAPLHQTAKTCLRRALLKQGINGWQTLHDATVPVCRLPGPNPGSGMRGLLPSPPFSATVVVWRQRGGGGLESRKEAGEFGSMRKLGKGERKTNEVYRPEGGDWLERIFSNPVRRTGTFWAVPSPGIKGSVLRDFRVLFLACMNRYRHVKNLLIIFNFYCSIADFIFKFKV